MLINDWSNNWSPSTSDSYNSQLFRNYLRSHSTHLKFLICHRTIGIRIRYCIIISIKILNTSCVLLTPHFHSSHSISSGLFFFYITNLKFKCFLNHNKRKIIFLRIHLCCTIASLGASNKFSPSITASFKKVRILRSSWN